MSIDVKVYSWEGSRFFLEWSLTELLGARGSGAFAWGPLAAVCSPGPQKRVGSVASFLVAPAGPVPVRVPSRPLRYRSCSKHFKFLAAPPPSPAEPSVGGL